MPHAFLTASLTDEGAWLLDSACTHHMCNDRKLFNNSDFNSRADFLPVLGADLDSPLAVKGVGSISLNVIGGEILFKNVLHVPAIGRNLICVSRLLSDGYSFTFNSAQSNLPGCVVRLKNRIICYPVLKNNLWVIFPGEFPEAHVAATMADWHLRLGHVPPEVITSMVNNSSVSGLKVIPGGRKVEDSCLDCPLGKQHRAPLTSNKDKKPTVKLERILTDLSGPWAVPTCGRKCLYLLAFIDDCSHYAWIYLLKRKSDTFETFQKWKALVENQSDSHIKYLRSDNGGEFCSAAMEDFLDKAGITHEHTNAYTPQENGVAKRFNQTLQAKVQCLLETAQFPLSLWGEAAFTACTLYNLTLHSALPTGITPFQAWHGFQPSATPLHIFGCDVTVHIPDHKRKKPGSRAKWGKFVGYAQKQSGWRVWYPEDNVIIEARDVKFFDAPILSRCMNTLYSSSANSPLPSPTPQSSLPSHPNQTLSPVLTNPAYLSDDDPTEDAAASEGGKSDAAVLPASTVLSDQHPNPHPSVVDPIPISSPTFDLPDSTLPSQHSDPTKPLADHLPVVSSKPVSTVLPSIPEESTPSSVPNTQASAESDDPFSVPILDDLLNADDVHSEPGEPEDLVDSLDILPYSDRPLPRRSGRVTRKPTRLHYMRPGSPEDLPSSNMTISGVHTISPNTILNSVFPSTAPRLTDHSLMTSCFYSALSIPEIDPNTDACLPLTTENLTPDESSLCFLSEQTTITADPKTLAEALARPDGDKWKQAYDEEMQSIEHHDTYTWEPLPPGRTLVTGKLVFKLKPTRDGSLKATRSEAAHGDSAKRKDWTTMRSLLPW